MVYRFSQSFGALLSLSSERTRCEGLELVDLLSSICNESECCAGGDWWFWVLKYCKIACWVIGDGVLGASRSEVSRPVLNIENVVFERVNIWSAKMRSL
jgi:hypothetical protein